MDGNSTSMHVTEYDRLAIALLSPCQPAPIHGFPIDSALLLALPAQPLELEPLLLHSQQQQPNVVLPQNKLRISTVSDLPGCLGTPMLTLTPSHTSFPAYHGTPVFSPIPSNMNAIFQTMNGIHSPFVAHPRHPMSGYHHLTPFSPFVGMNADNPLDPLPLSDNYVLASAFAASKDTDLDLPLASTDGLLDFGCDMGAVDRFISHQLAEDAPVSPTSATEGYGFNDLLLSPMYAVAGGFLFPREQVPMTAFPDHLPLNPVTSWDSFLPTNDTAPATKATSRHAARRPARVEEKHACPYVGACSGLTFASLEELKVHTQAQHREELRDLSKAAAAGAPETMETASGVAQMEEGEGPAGLPRPYKCTYPGCSRAFSQPSNLRTHIVSHTGERKYKCSEPGCFHSYTTSNRLKVHVREHTGERPYKCGAVGCDYSAKQACSLRQHKVRHLPFEQKKVEFSKMLRTLPCRLCQRKYRNDKSLSAHWWRDHGRAPSPGPSSSA
ncbi:hypothetical protein BC830DRAFT_1171447 [Chytriomyces sp. MP71]|nr:hypothetical protein BC830DRAFT_1171447 [Chytriomyces sp. MP71]